MTPIAELIEAATAARAKAYAPYSCYLVGAALLDVNGGVWTGCNVENISYGLSVCAERTAICKMVSEGVREVMAIVVVTLDGGTPCGMCLQTLLEFVRDPVEIEVVTVSEIGIQNRYKLSDLIPHGFVSEKLRRT